MLKVREALSKDVGRAIVRIDPDDMKKMGLEVCDIVEIEGKRKTAAKVLPCYTGERGKSIIQMDGIIRENSQVGIDEKVNLLKAIHSPAEKITVTPLALSNLLNRNSNKKYIGSLIEGLSVMTGDRIRATLFGSKFYDFKVLDTKPEGVVLINSTTVINTKTEGAVVNRPARISYEDIGGLNKQIRRVREMIELPLKYPLLFEKLGIEPPKGVLLYGPPGTGKTLIARAVANETDACFTSISGPEIMGKFYGESESRLRTIFTNAQKRKPSIIFIDEIDAIAPKREDMGGEKQVEKRVVSQLLSLMDGLESRGEVIVIGATNLPDTIDQALRRPGRFDREIAISIPDKKERLEILRIHTRGMPLSEKVNLEKLSEITHGFVGADLEALSREAAMSALRSILSEIDFNSTEIPYEMLLSLEVTMDHFYEAMKEVEPSALREFFVEVPDVKWNDVGGLENIKSELKETIEWPLKHSELFEQLKTKPSKGILLHGPPGTGKTLLAKAVANESGVNLISIKGPQLMSRYVGESERGVREIFKKAKQTAPTILFLDEIDSLIPVRGGDNGGGAVTERVIGQFLTEMDGIEELKGVLVLAATNRLDLIDRAMIRSGRFDLVLELSLPDEKVRREIFKIHTRGKPMAKEIVLNDLAAQTDGQSGADIEFICHKASLFAMKDFIKGGKKKKITIKKAHFEQALKMKK